MKENISQYCQSDSCLSLSMRVFAINENKFSFQASSWFLSLNFVSCCYIGIFLRVVSVRSAALMRGHPIFWQYPHVSLYKCQTPRHSIHRLFKLPVSDLRCKNAVINKLTCARSVKAFTNAMGQFKGSKSKFQMKYGNSLT